MRVQATKTGRRSINIGAYFRTKHDRVLLMRFSKLLPTQVWIYTESLACFASKMGSGNSKRSPLTVQAKATRGNRARGKKFEPSLLRSTAMSFPSLELVVPRLGMVEQKTLKGNMHPKL